MTSSNQAEPWLSIEQRGPYPFVTFRLFHDRLGRVRQWYSRHHRKRLPRPDMPRQHSLARILWQCAWMPGELNWWIGTIFALGASLFALGSVVSLWPEFTQSISLSAKTAGPIYFLGSIPFTTAAYLQLFQAANADPLPDSEETPEEHWAWFGWKPGDLGWLSCALQFIGTVLFNVNTFDGMLPALTWQQQDLLVWVPNILGSILFLASGYLAFIEVAHAYWQWKLNDLSWWIVFINLLGCIGFLLSAFLAVVMPGGEGPWHEASSTSFTLVGAIFFFWGALLMLPETVDT